MQTSSFSAGGRRAAKRASATVMATAAAISLASCVTTVEGPTRRGIPLTASSSSSTGTNVASPRETPVVAPVPEGPVARPASESSTREARTTVAVMEVGMIPNDGQVLPLVSPDGRFLAVQSGMAPTWNVILGAGPQSPPVDTRVAAYSIDEASLPEKKAGSGVLLRPIAWSGALPNGAVLGRSSDNTGFLVEGPQANGERWIGKVDWISGSVRWLVQDQAVNSGASLGPAGELAYSRRGVGEDRREVVIRKAGSFMSPAQEIVLEEPGVSFSFPSFGDEPGVVFVFASSVKSLDLQAYRIPTTPGSTALTFLGSRQLLDHADEAAAYRACSMVDVPAVGASGGSGIEGTFSGWFVFFHPGQGRMCVFEHRTGAIKPLAEGSMGAIAVTPSRSGGGGGEAFVFTTEKALKYVEFPGGGGAGGAGSAPRTEQAMAGVKLISGALLPKQTTNKQWPFVLVGPGSMGGQGAYRIFKMRFGERN